MEWHKYQKLHIISSELAPNFWNTHFEYQMKEIDKIKEKYRLYLLIIPLKKYEIPT